MPRGNEENRSICTKEKNMLHFYKKYGIIMEKKEILHDGYGNRIDLPL